MFIAAAANLVVKTALHLLNKDSTRMNKDGRPLHSQPKSAKHLTAKDDDDEKRRHDDDPFREMNEVWVKWHRPPKFQKEKGCERGIRVLTDPIV